MIDTNPYQTPESGYGALKSADTEGEHRKPSGLGGWLILVAIGLIFSPLRLVAFFLQTFVPLFQDGAWGALTTPGSEQYHVLWAPLLIFEIVANLGFIVAHVVLAFLFFRKSRLFPKTYIALALINLCFIIIDTWFVSFVLPDEPMLDPDTTKEIVRSLVSAAIWVPYMMVSKRVKNTFVK
jgi:hypothetical protein